MSDLKLLIFRKKIFKFRRNYEVSLQGRWGKRQRIALKNRRIPVVFITYTNVLRRGMTSFLVPLSAMGKQQNRLNLLAISVKRLRGWKNSEFKKVWRWLRLRRTVLLRKHHCRTRSAPTTLMGHGLKNVSFQRKYVIFFSLGNIIL